MKLLTILLLSLSLTVFAGGPEDDEEIIDGGFEYGGGHSVVLDGEHYLLDFVEAGIEDDVYLSEGAKDLMNAKDEILSAAPRLGADVLEAVNDKLNDIYSRVPEFAVELKNNFVEYNWRLIRKKLVKVKDYGPSAIELEDGAEVYQVALRDDIENTVSINKSLWKKLALEQKVGLVLHEVIYGIEVKRQSSKHSYKSRLLNGIFFDSYELNRVTFEKLVKRISRVTKKENYLTPEKFALLVNGGEEELNRLRREVRELGDKIIDHFNSYVFNYKKAVPGYGGDLSTYRSTAERIETCKIEVYSTLRHPTHRRMRSTDYITEKYNSSFFIYSMADARTDAQIVKNNNLRKSYAKSCKALKSLEDQIYN